VRRHRPPNGQENNATTRRLAIARWPTPEALVRDGHAKAHAETRFKADSFFALKAVAESITPEAGISDELLAEAGVSASIQLRLLAACGLAPRRPATTSLERLARRYWGIEPGPEDGRGHGEMLLGRMLRPDEHGRVYGAAEELASRICLPKAPDCGRCPLRPLCASAPRLAPSPVPMAEPQEAAA